MCANNNSCVSKSLGLTLRIMILPTEIKYRDGYVNAFKQLRDEYGLQVICTRSSRA